MWSRRSTLTHVPIHADYASSIHDNEHGVINPAIINITIDPFSPIRGVHYIWVLTQDPQTQGVGDVYMGVENLLDNPQAFHEGTASYLNNEKKKQDAALELIQKGPEFKHGRSLEASAPELLKMELTGLGHPTLAIQFDDAGKSIPAKGCIAGEFFYDSVFQEWCLNDRSGRFKRVQKSLVMKMTLLTWVVEQIKLSTATESAAGIQPRIEVIAKSREPKDLWERYLRKSVTKDHIGAGVELIMRALKYSLPERRPDLDDPSAGMLKAKNTPEYKQVMYHLTQQPFDHLAQLVDYCVSPLFFKVMQNIFRECKQEIPKSWEEKRDQFVQVLRQKSQESERDLSCEAKDINRFSRVMIQAVSAPSRKTATLWFFKSGYGWGCRLKESKDLPEFRLNCILSKL